MKTVVVLISLVILMCYGCDIPYSNEFGPGDLDRLLEAQGEDTICLSDGFDTACIKVIPGTPGKDGKDGKDGQTFIAIREVPVEIIVEKIIETVVVEEVVKEVPVEKIVEIVSLEYVDREIPIEVFVGRTVEVIKEVIKEVPVEKTVIREVPVERIVEVVRTVYLESDEQTGPIQVTDGAVYTEAGYHNPPAEFHAHEFSHTHDGATHTHQIIHPDGENDDWDREHAGYAGLAHD